MDENIDKSFSKTLPARKVAIGERAEGSSSFAALAGPQSRGDDLDEGKKAPVQFTEKFINAKKPWQEEDQALEERSEAAGALGTGSFAASRLVRRSAPPIDFFSCLQKTEFLREFSFLKSVAMKSKMPRYEAAKNVTHALCLNMLTGDKKQDDDFISKWALLADHIFYAKSRVTKSAAAFALVTAEEPESEKTAFISVFCSSLKTEGNSKGESVNFMFRVLAALKRLGFLFVTLTPTSYPDGIRFYNRCGFLCLPTQRKKMYMGASLANFKMPAALDVAYTIEDAIDDQAYLALVRSDKPCFDANRRPQISEAFKRQEETRRAGGGPRSRAEGASSFAAPPMSAAGLLPPARRTSLFRDMPNDDMRAFLLLFQSTVCKGALQPVDGVFYAWSFVPRVTPMPKDGLASYVPADLRKNETSGRREQGACKSSIAGRAPLCVTIINKGADELNVTLNKNQATRRKTLRLGAGQGLLLTLLKDFPNTFQVRPVGKVVAGQKISLDEVEFTCFTTPPPVEEF